MIYNKVICSRCNREICADERRHPVENSTSATIYVCDYCWNKFYIADG